MQGDTLQGFIDYQELGGKEPRTLAFKSGEGDTNIREFTPANSRYVVLKNLVAYQSFQGRISQDAITLKNLSPSMDSTTAKAHIYLRVLQKGKNVSLYAYSDDLKTRFFLQTGQEAIKELKFKKFYYHTNQVRTIKGYIGQLWLAALQLQLDSPALKKKIEESEYTKEDLLSIVSQLNGLSEEEQKKIRGKNTRLFAGVGLSRTAFTVEGKHGLAGTGKSKDSYLPKISLGIDVFQNRDIQKFFFRGELILHAATQDISGESFEFNTDRTFRQSFMQPTLTMAPQLGYNLYNRDNLKFNLGLGVSFSYSTYINNYYHETSIYRPSGQVLSDRKTKGKYEFVSTWFAVPLRAGLVLNRKTDISLLYFLRTPLTQYVGFSFSRSTLQVGVNYLFNK
ncbi:MAG: hypothetical protein ACO1O1_08675 [Adhaeribacter sp.]